ncbi:MAG: hypothetical protein AABZ06_01960 [Bdellovibrionota bacterium]
MQTKLRLQIIPVVILSVVSFMTSWTPTGPAITSAYAGCDSICSEVLKDPKKATESQVGPQCAAYKASEDSKVPEKVLLALNLGVATTCGFACVSEKFNPTISQICSVGAMGAGVAEVIVTLSQKSSIAQKMISVAGGAAGTYMGYKGAKEVENISKASTRFREAREARDAAMDQENTHAAINAELDADDAIKDKVAAKKKSKSDSCKTAVVFGIMAGLRAVNLNQHDETKKKACGEVNQLASANGISVDGSGGSSAPSKANSGTSAGLASYEAASQGLTCISSQGGLAACPVVNGQPVSLEATDAGIMSRSGLDRVAAPVALAGLEKMAGQLDGAVNAGSMMAAMAGELGEFGNALAQVAKTAQDNPREFMDLLPISSAIASTGGGIVKQAGDSQGGNAFGSLFGNTGSKQTGASGVDSAAFQAKQSTDIWHADSALNIFQIVSDRIGKSSNGIAH